jgi:hypothetical protein
VPDRPIPSVLSVDHSAVNSLFRRVAAIGVATALAALVVCDLSIAGFRTWWDRHSLTGAVVSSLLVLAVTALIVDEVVARRQRQARAVSVAVQGLIVYAQARRAHDAVTTAGGADDARSGVGAEELRTLASMLLTASPSLFDDPQARRFLEQVERFSVLMYKTISSSPGGIQSADNRERLTSQISQLQVTMQPLVARIPTQDRSVFEGLPSA